MGKKLCLLVPGIPCSIQISLHTIWTCKLLRYLQPRFQDLLQRMEWNSSISMCCSVIGNNGIPTWSKPEYQCPNYNTRAYLVQKVWKPRDNKVLSFSFGHPIRYVLSPRKMQRGTSILPRMQLAPLVVDPQSFSEGSWDSGAAYSWQQEYPWGFEWPVVLRKYEQSKNNGEMGSNFL